MNRKEAAAIIQRGARDCHELHQAIAALHPDDTHEWGVLDLRANMSQKGLTYAAARAEIEGAYMLGHQEKDAVVLIRRSWHADSDAWEQIGMDEC
jgi:hypothetical protein